MTVQIKNVVALYITPDVIQILTVCYYLFLCSNFLQCYLPTQPDISIYTRKTTNIPENCKNTKIEI